jgi:hypothetical protein
MEVSIPADDPIRMLLDEIDAPNQGRTAGIARSK